MGTEGGAQVPTFPKPTAGVTTCLCSLAWLWEATSSDTVGFCGMKARGTEGCHLASVALALGPSCEKLLTLSTK